MKQRIQIPADLVELFRNPEEIRRVFKFVRAMQHFAATLDGNTAPLMESDENAAVDISDIVPRFRLPPQSAATDGLFLMSNATEGTESWSDPGA
jgi:hypothetical protein